MLFQLCQQSGNDAFCVLVPSATGALYRLRRDASQGKVARSATRLLPVRVSGAGAAHDESAILDIECGGVGVRVPDRVDPHYVAALMAALASRC